MNRKNTPVRKKHSYDLSERKITMKRKTRRFGRKTPMIRRTRRTRLVESETDTYHLSERKSIRNDKKHAGLKGNLLWNEEQKPRPERNPGVCRGWALEGGLWRCASRMDLHGQGIRCFAVGCVTANSCAEKRQTFALARQGCVLRMSHALSGRELASTFSEPL